jgi:hypothetical protein
VPRTRSSPRRNPPWRSGVTFDAPSSEATARWFDRLVAAYPGLATFQLAPAELDAGDVLRLGPALRVDPDLGPDEVAVLRAIGAGIAVEKLRDLLAHDWPAVEGVLFAMLGKKHLTLDSAAAGARPSSELLELQLVWGSPARRPVRPPLATGGF